MADSENNCDLEDESGEETSSPKAALSTSFTISFEDEDQSVSKQKKMMKTGNMFVRRHVRTLSLPIGNSYVPKQTDCENPSGNREVSLTSNNKTDDQRIESKKDLKPKNKYFPTESDNLESTESDDCLKQNGNQPISDSDSEGGTYTLDKGGEEVLAARKTIDQVFGISPSAESNSNNAKPACEEKGSKSRMVDEWIEQSASVMKTTNISSNGVPVTMKPCLKVNYFSKIPSPVFGRREFNLKGTDSHRASNKPNVATASAENCRRNSGIEPKTLEQPVNSPTNGDIDTVSYLKETENIVAALHNRLKSGLKQCNESEKETSGDKYSNTRFNRAFSLRRDRLKKSTLPVINTTVIPVRKNSFGKTTSVSLNSSVTNTNGYTPPITEKKMNSSRNTKLSSGVVLKTKEQTKADDLKKKPNQRSKVNGSLRSNSSLSAQEIEFQNWKRRKSYDPLKAAAEDRKKKSMMQSVAGGSASVSTIVLMKKQKSPDQNEIDEPSEKGITRSASFHGLRNKNGHERFMFSEANNINRSSSSRFIPNNDSNLPDTQSNLDDDDWVIPKPPSTSLQNTPPESVSSRLSLLSHAMSSSSVILSSSSNTKVNYMTLLNVTELTREIQSTVSSIANSLNVGKWDEHSVSQKENGSSLESKTECSENIDADNDENTFYADNDFELDEDYTPETADDDSKSHDLSGNYQLNVALNNLKQIQDTVQKLQLFCANK